MILWVPKDFVACNDKKHITIIIVVYVFLRKKTICFVV